MSFTQTLAPSGETRTEVGVLNCPSPEPQSTTFDLPEFSLKQVRDAVPAHLFKRNGLRSFSYFVRDIVCLAACFSFTFYADRFVTSAEAKKAYFGNNDLLAFAARAAVWANYWWWQGLVFTSIWVVGHECGHGSFSESRLFCDVVGFISHSFTLTPYWSWATSHHSHHMNHNSIENDEVFVPKTRSRTGLRPGKGKDNDALLETIMDSPVVTCINMIIQQVFAVPAYLLFNVSGKESYPRFTNHFDPNSKIFKPNQWAKVHLSTLGILAMFYGMSVAAAKYGWGAVVAYYVIPYAVQNHWFLMSTYLHHTAVFVPHYRKGAWNFQRGAASTIDRPFLGWMGRFFLHNVNHDHVAHHFFPKMPFYNTPLATPHIKKVLGAYYLYDDTPLFKAFWESYTTCIYVEDQGDVVFYHDKNGNAQRAWTGDTVKL